MRISIVLGVAVFAGAIGAQAQQPAVYPLRSQTAATQGVDSAYCYWQARRQTNVDMARQSQRPVRTKPLQFAADSGRGASEPPLPAPQVASGSAAHAAEPGMQASGGRAAASAEGASLPAAGASGHPAAASGAAGLASTSAPKLPPLPPPQPPMETYWQAYGDCMQSKGYGVH